MSREMITNRQSGFTLTEVLASMVLIGAAMTPVLHALVNAQVTGTRAQRATQAIFCAERKIEDVRAELLESFSTDVSTMSEALANGIICNVSEAADGNLLKIVKVEAGYDENRNGALDADEIVAVLDTKVSDRM